ncbi:MAG: DMT family transporter [Microbacterium sp.]
MSGVEGTRVPSAPFLLAALATVVAGVGMAVQGTANGELGGVLGSGVYAATFSFLTGLAILVVITLCAPTARAGVLRAWRAVRSGEFPWWMTLGGLSGATIVLSQALTVPVLGVSVFTMAFIAGQLTGALGVDNSSLPPGGRKPPTVWRILGTVIVLAGVSLSAIGVLVQGVPLWAPGLPFLAGLMTSFQQAFNGRLRVAARSAITANLTNFLTGSIFLVLCSAVLFGTGTRIAALPEMPGQAWMLLGGVLGIIFIGTTTVTVAKLGVLLLSLMSLFGNLIGSLAIDLTFHSAHAEVTGVTFLSMGVVLAGVVVTNIPRTGRGPTSTSAT